MQSMLNNTCNKPMYHNWLLIIIGFVVAVCCNICFCRPEPALIYPADEIRIRATNTAPVDYGDIFNFAKKKRKASDFDMQMEVHSISSVETSTAYERPFADKPNIYNGSPPLTPFTIPIFPTNPTIYNCGCESIIQPVCGTDGSGFNTYMNECVLKCNALKNSRLRVDYQGTCCDNTRCHDAGPPICDSNGQIYDNFCLFEFSQCVELRKHGTYSTISNDLDNCIENRPCSNEHNPVCDTRGVTHRNQCYFNIARRVAELRFKQKAPPELDYHGTCCNNACVSITQPYFALCDSENQTHANFCEFNLAQCLVRKKFNKHIEIVKFGTC